MKDYLNSEERRQLIAVLHLLTNIKLLQESKNTLTKQEIADLKRSETYLTKIIKGVVGRLNPNAQKAFSKAAKSTKLFVDIGWKVDEYAKKKNAKIDAGVELNEEYFRLVELLLWNSCQNCTKCGKDCDIYKEFEDHCVPDLSDFEHTGKCKYSYKAVEKKNGYSKTQKTNKRK